jgi:hypothetical protein
MYTIPSDESIVACRITKDAVLRIGEPEIERRELAQGKRKSIAQKILTKAGDESA